MGEAREGGPSRGSRNPLRVTAALSTVSAEAERGGEGGGGVVRGLKVMCLGRREADEHVYRVPSMGIDQEVKVLP